MKKKIFGVVIMAAIAVTAGWNMSQNENEVKLSDLALENVEALAQSEGGGFSGYEHVQLIWDGGMGGGMTKRCWSPGSRIC